MSLLIIWLCSPSYPLVSNIFRSFDCPVLEITDPVLDFKLAVGLYTRVWPVANYQPFKECSIILICLFPLIVIHYSAIALKESTMPPPFLYIYLFI